MPARYGPMPSTTSGGSPKSVKPINGARGVMLAASADGTSGATAQLIPQFENLPEVTILFTGYVNPTTPAERLAKSGRAQNHALERASAAVRHDRAGARDTGDNSDPCLLRSRQTSGACRGAWAGTRDDGCGSADRGRKLITRHWRAIEMNSALHIPGRQGKAVVQVRPVAAD